MITITRISNIDDKKHIALLDTSSISFMQGLEKKGILSDCSCIYIPDWTDKKLFATVCRKIRCA